MTEPVRVKRAHLISSTTILAMLLVPSLVAAEGRGLRLKIRASESEGAPIVEEVQLYSQSHALVIGLDRYAEWPSLNNAIRDATAVASELRGRGFSVQLGQDLDSEELERVLENFFIDKGSDRNARLFVWYAGHGATYRSEGYLVPSDAPLPARRPAEFRKKALSLRRFGELVREAESKHVLAIFDSCFAGTIFRVGRSAPPPAITRKTTKSVRQFVSSGDADQEVSDDGTFRKLFIEALRGERGADANRDGYLTGSELGLFLEDSVTNYTNNSQVPKYGKLRDPRYDQGDFVFAISENSATNQGNGSQPTYSVSCPPGARWDGSQCVGSRVACPRGSRWSGSECVADSATPSPAPSDTKSQPQMTLEECESLKAIGYVADCSHLK